MVLNFNSSYVQEYLYSYHIYQVYTVAPVVHNYCCITRQVVDLEYQYTCGSAGVMGWYDNARAMGWVLLSVHK